MKQITINGSLQYSIVKAEIMGGDLYVSLDMDFEEAKSIFEESKNVEITAGTVVTGKFPHVKYVSTSFGTDTQDMEDIEQEPQELATVRLHILSEMEYQVEELIKTQAEQDIAIAEIYGGM